VLTFRRSAVADTYPKGLEFPFLLVVAHKSASGRRKRKNLLGSAKAGLTSL
jgi:hypothetical protein